MVTTRNNPPGRALSARAGMHAGPGGSRAVALPAYLQDHYWWAYLHPTAVWFWDRRWLVDLILLGNMARLRDAALDEFGTSIDTSVLQISCVYGDFSPCLARRLGPTGTLDLVDVAPVQLGNVRAKLQGLPRVSLHQQDSTALRFADASFDDVVVFFLLHEQPDEARRRTIAEAIRVVRPGGRVVFVDFHRPGLANPFRYWQSVVFRVAEPFARDLWRAEIADWFPPGWQPAKLDKQTYFGGLYQKVVVRR
jgi:ubiquinone/menaquinone biosynthesis C-methylase UbiE